MPQDPVAHIPGFEAHIERVEQAEYLVAAGGDGPPLLLLHGFPETHACWSEVAPALAEVRRVIAPDIRGYGATHAPPGGARGEGYSKREMAGEMVELMSGLGHERFSVVGHDRGARVAYRLALEQPDRVDRLAVLNIVPTVDQFERMGGGPSLGYWPWFFLAQPKPFPETVIGAAPAALLDYVFDTWPSEPAAIPPWKRGLYLEALGRSTIAAMCGDYRASYHLDQDHDADDREAGRRIAAPTLAIAGEDERQLWDLEDVWSRWAGDVVATTVSGGHFIPEESPDELAEILADFLADGELRSRTGRSGGAASAEASGPTSSSGRGAPSATGPEERGSTSRR